MEFPDNKLLKISMRLVACVGGWRIFNWKNSKIETLYKCYSLFSHYYFLEYICRSYLKLCLLLVAETLDVEEIFGNMCITLLYTISFVQMKTFKSEKLKNLFAAIIETEERILNYGHAEIQKIYMGFVNYNIRCNILFIINSWMVSLLYYVRPFCVEPQVVAGNNNETLIKRPLPLSTWWPIDPQKHYIVAYSYNLCEAILGSTYVISSNLMTFSLIIYALSQLEILNWKARRFPLSKSGSINNNVLENKYMLKAEFIHLIEEHKKIVEYIDTFNAAMKYVVLFDFLQCSLQLATITLQLLVMEINIQNLVFVGEFALTMLIRLTIYYFNANEIIIKSENIAMSIWHSDWYNQDEDMKRMVLIFMMRTQRRLNLLIGPFGIMSLETFIRILKATYSYVMIFTNTTHE